LYGDAVEPWWHRHAGPEWARMRRSMMEILQKESELEEIIKLVGPDVLPETDKLVLLEAEMIRENFLMQYAFHPHDTYTDPVTQFMMMNVMFTFFAKAGEAIGRGVPVSRIRELPVMGRFARMGAVPVDERPERFRDIMAGIDTAMEEGEG
jgi:V/A-type H+-transporting ATPase subunit A